MKMHLSKSGLMSLLQWETMKSQAPGPKDQKERERNPKRTKTMKSLNKKTKR